VATNGTPLLSVVHIGYDSSTVQNSMDSSLQSAKTDNIPLVRSRLGTIALLFKTLRSLPYNRLQLARLPYLARSRLGTTFLLYRFTLQLDTTDVPFLLRTIQIGYEISTL